MQNNFNTLIAANDQPQVIDDALARNDWNWSYQYGIDELCEVIYFKMLIQLIYNIYYKFPQSHQNDFS